MNEKETSTCWMIGIGLVLIYSMILYQTTSLFWAAKKTGQKLRMDLVLACVPLHILVFVTTLLLWSHYRAQMSSQIDSSGVTWKTLFGKKKIAWSEVTALCFTPLRGGQKALLIQSKTQQFKIELPLLKHPDQYVQFVEAATQHKVYVGRGLF